MPHQCVRCGTVYENGSNVILKGCSCGAKLFFFVKESALTKSDEMIAKLSENDKEQIEQDVLGLIGDDVSEDDRPVILDFESIRVPKPGKFELDLVHLFKKDPLVFRMGEGKYVIDLHSVFSKNHKNE